MDQLSRLDSTAIAPRAASAPPHWAKIAAHIAAVLPLPSGIWRIALVVGLPSGYTAEGLADLNLDEAGGLSLIVLTLLIEGAALLTLGLVSPWGEHVPGWIPRWGGRRVCPRLVVLAASVGAAVLLVMWTPLVTWWSIPHPELTDSGSTLVGLLYVPLVAWAPLLVAVTIDYHRRHNPTRPQSHPTPIPLDPIRTTASATYPQRPSPPNLGYDE